jgi:hypothetical protein
LCCDNSTRSRDSTREARLHPAALKPPFHRVAKRLPRRRVDPHSFAPHRGDEETPSQRMIRTAYFVAGNEREPDHHHPPCARAPVRPENDVKGKKRKG